MAETDTTSNQPNPNPHFCSELLSPSKLFDVRSRSHKIPPRGQKDFLPSHPSSNANFDSQQQLLEQSLNEHWTLVAEERVERLGSVARGLWIPDEGVVELQMPAGKFWQTMGYSADGKQYLLPEEALYLMECGNLQVFHQDLPLSIEEGYQNFLSTDHTTLLTLQQYQVYGHLKRLGYVVIRFDPGVQSIYEQQLNLPTVRDRLRKRKHSQSHRHEPPNSHSGETETEIEREKEEFASGEMETQEEDTSKPPIAPPSPQLPQGPLQAEPLGEEEEGCGGGRNWWLGEMVTEEMVEKGALKAKSPPPLWDFGCIHFPDLGSSAVPPALPAPLSSLLPGGLEVSECHIAPWLQHLNLRPNCPPHREWHKQNQRQRNQRDQRQRHGDHYHPERYHGNRYNVDHNPEGHHYRKRYQGDRYNVNHNHGGHYHGQRYHRDLNADREVRCCRNWAEFLELQERRRSWHLNHGSRPAHLWEGAVKPLTQPGQASCHGELLGQISIIGSSKLLDQANSLSIPPQWKISFDVFQPDTATDYKKSNPGKPYTRMAVCSFEGPVPRLCELKSLSCQSGLVPVIFAVVDHGDISFYCYTPTNTPTDTHT